MYLFNSNSSLLMQNGITILLALIAGMIALYQVKLNIFSKARLTWIESLRETISLYCMEVANFSVKKINLFDERKKIKNKDADMDIFLDKYYIPYELSASKVDKLQTKVLLYLDSNNKEQKKIEDLILHNIVLLHDRENDNHEQINNNIHQIITHSKSIFNKEWNKAKNIYKL